jgi:hypothetical protein
MLLASAVGASPAGAQDSGNDPSSGSGEALPAEVTISGVLPGVQPPLCIQQVGDYDQAYVEAYPDLQFQLGVTCPERGYTEYDRTATEGLFDEPDKPGNGAYRLPADR